ncbi:MAG TPA: 6-bladed beta-propeller, partial [Gemmatimonadales bacterium]|nr:6-bladed beta-propeller [Gemmatimonadales bacterium]
MKISIETASRAPISAVAIALLLSFAGCADGKSTAALSPTIDTLPGGAVRVVNHGPSEWSGTDGWQLELELVIASADSGPAMLSSRRHLVVAPGGEIVVLDRRPAVLRVFSADGGFLRTIGREGSGPGEYLDFGELTIVGDTLVVNDRQNSRLVLFNIDGTHLRTFPAERTGMWPVATSDGRIQLDTYLARRQSTPQDAYPGSGVRRMRTDGVVTDSFFYPAQPEGMIWRLRDEKNDLGAFVPFAPEREKTLDRLGNLIYGDQSAYRLIVSSKGSDTLRIIEAPVTLVTISDSVRQAELDDVLGYAEWAAGIARLEDIPVVYPAWTDLRVDAGGNIWV